MTKLTAACIQLNSGNDVVQNIDKASALITKAAKTADFIALPENAFLMAENKDSLFANSYAMDNNFVITKMQDLAKKLSVSILIGGLAIKAQNSKKLANRSILLNQNGEISAYYDKIHMFDVKIPDGESHTESERYEAGKKLVITDLLGAKLGMSICYDLRFPNHYREMAKQGAEIFSVPAAFTYKTGQAHWEVLLRARAIENGAYVIAPALCGEHPANRKTWGNSMIINPWGEILAKLDHEEGFITAEIDTAKVTEARNAIPSLKNN